MKELEEKENIKQIKTQEVIKKHSSLYSRVATAFICLPILFIMLYFQFLYTILMVAVIYISHSEFHILQEKILSKMINNYYAEITWKTLMSSPLSTYIFMLCPIILYFFKNFELFACIVPLSILEIYRIYNFILIYRVLNTNETNFNYGFFDSGDKNKEQFSRIEKMPNPIKAAIKKEHLDETIDKTKKEDLKIIQSNNPKEYGFLNKLMKLNETHLNSNLRFEKSKKDEIVKNKFEGNDVISINMFNSCLIIIMLDFIFFFIYVYPVCLGISVHHYSQHGFLSLLLAVIIAYQCDNGALAFGSKFGKRPFGHPVTPSKTIEGLYGGIITGFVSAYLFRYLVYYFSEITVMSNFSFLLYVLFSVFTAILGDFFESFIKRCADVKDSGNLLPGHGGLLDRIDSVTLSISVIYYFSF